MLNENIKAIRRSKGLSQQELAVKVNVVRQTVSKWEQGLSVPDSDLLIAVCVGILAVAGVLAAVNSPYLGWDYSAPETAVMGVAIHAFEWGFVRLAPFALIAALVGIFIESGDAVGAWMDAVSIYIVPLGALIAAVMFFWVCPKGYAREQVQTGRDKTLGGWFEPVTRYLFVGITFIVYVLGIFFGGIG